MKYTAFQCNNCQTQICLPSGERISGIVCPTCRGRLTPHRPAQQEWQRYRCKMCHLSFGMQTSRHPSRCPLCNTTVPTPHGKPFVWGLSEPAVADSQPVHATSASETEPAASAVRPVERTERKKQQPGEIPSPGASWEHMIGATLLSVSGLAAPFLGYYIAGWSGLLIGAAALAVLSAEMAG